MNKRLLLLLSMFLMGGLVPAYGTTIPWDAGSQTYYLDMPPDSTNYAPDLGTTGTFYVKFGYWRTSEPDWEGTGTWSFELEDGKTIKDITIKVHYYTQYRPTDGRQNSYFGTSQSDITQEIGRTPTSVVETGTYEKTFHDVGVDTVYFKHYMTARNKPTQQHMYNVEITATPVPEPSSLLLLISGIGVCYVRRNRK